LRRLIRLHVSICNLRVGIRCCFFAGICLFGSCMYLSERCIARADPLMEFSYIFSFLKKIFQFFLKLVKFSLIFNFIGFNFINLLMLILILSVAPLLFRFIYNKYIIVEGTFLSIAIISLSSYTFAGVPVLGITAVTGYIFYKTGVCIWNWLI